MELYTYRAETGGERIDRYLNGHLEGLSRSYIQKLVQENNILVNGKPVKANYIIRENDVITVQIPDAETPDILPENIPLDIIYQDHDLAIINKPVNLVVHPSPGHPNHTLVNAIMYHIKDLSTINGIYRPGIVHRLDKDTTGLLVVAKNDYAHQFLANQLKDHTMSRTYICLVKGLLETKKGIIKTLIGRDKNNRLKNAVVKENGKEAITEFEVIETIGDKYSLVKCHLKTGRTHQIRVHMDFIKHPIVNDPLYGLNNKIGYNSNQLLHAYQLELIHPTTKEKMCFTAELPVHFLEAIAYLKGGK